MNDYRKYLLNGNYRGIEKKRKRDFTAQSDLHNLPAKKYLGGGTS